jgi:hypothetical protein
LGLRRRWHGNEGPEALANAAKFMAVPVESDQIIKGLDFKLISLISFFHNCSVAGEPGKELYFPRRKLSGSSDFIWR